MARPSINEVRSLVDFQKTYEWEFSFLTFPNFLDIDATRFDIQCLSTEVPKRTGDNPALMMRGEQIFDMGIYKAAGTIQLTFVETVDAQIRRLIKNWSEACYNKTFPFVDLVADLRLVTANNQSVANWEYNLYYCFLLDSTIPTLTGGEGEPMQPTITLCYTDFDEQAVQ